MARLSLTYSLRCNAFRQFALQTGSATEIRKRMRKPPVLRREPQDFSQKKSSTLDFQAEFAGAVLSSLLMIHNPAFDQGAL